MQNSIWLLCLLACLLVACSTTAPATDQPSAPVVTTETPSPPADTLEPSSPRATIIAVAETPTAVATGEVLATTPDGDNTVAWSDDDLAPTSLATADFPEARSIDVAVSNGAIYVALGIEEHIFVTHSVDDGRTFTEPVLASRDQPALVLAIERPAIVASGDGRVSVAWSSPDYEGSIWFAHSGDSGDSFGPSIRLSGSPQMETVLPRMALDPAENPLVVWLERSTLRLARSADGGQSFAASELLDDRTCDCCHPQPLVSGKHLFIAYRNLEVEGGQQIRDIFFAASADNGATFTPEVRVSDSHWYLNACPISGPALAFDGQTIYVSWMDGRHDSLGNFSHTDIWLATSTDGGQSFSTNRRVNPTVAVYNNLPSLALDASGQLHVIWEAREAEQDVIYYARSADSGRSFTSPAVLVSSQDGSGRKRPGNASLAIGPNGTIYVTWIDTLGAHAGAWLVE